MAFGLPGTAAFLPAASTGGCGESGHVSVGPFSAELRHLLAFHAAGVRPAHRWLADESLLTPATAFLNDVLAGAVERLSRDLAPVNR
jgi:hypothetical protein